jgi:hypothetical protein
VPVPGVDQLLLSLPTGNPRSPWCVLDLASGAVERGAGMPGALRAAVFPAASDPHARPWALATFGLCQLELQPPLRAAAVARKGIGTYQTELLEIGDDLLGISQRRGKSLLLVSRQDGSTRKRVQVAGACAAYPVDDGAVRLIGPHHAQAADLDPATGRVLARHHLPYGKHAMHAAGQVFALLGDRKDITFAIEGQEREPGQTLVLAVGASDMPPGGMGWDVLPRELTVLDAVTLKIARSAPCPPDAVKVLGIDRDGLVVVGTLSGFALFDSQSLAMVDTYQFPGFQAGSVEQRSTPRVTGSPYSEAITTRTASRP